MIREEGRTAPIKMMMDAVLYLVMISYDEGRRKDSANQNDDGCCFILSDDQRPYDDDAVLYLMKKEGPTAPIKMMMDAVLYLMMISYGEGRKPDSAHQNDDGCCFIPNDDDDQLCCFIPREEGKKARQRPSK